MKVGSLVKVIYEGYPEYYNSIGVIRDMDDKFVEIYFAKNNTVVCIGLELALEHTEVI